MAYLQSLRLIRKTPLFSNIPRTLINHPVRCVTLKTVQQDVSFDSLGHEERNEKIGRPQSPHLSIYKPQLTSVLSVMHRASGLALSYYIWAFGIGCLSSDFNTVYANLVEMNLNPGLVFLAKLALGGPVVYHCVNGVRHLCWDLGKFLTIKEVYSTGYVSLAVAMVGLLYLLFA